MLQLKSISRIIVSFALLTAFIFQDVAAKDGERTGSFKVNPGGNLVVRVSPGNITLRTWLKNEVFVKVTGLDEEELEEVKLAESKNTVTVKFESEWGWSDDVEFLIDIPSGFNLDLKTTGGDVKINGEISGGVKISSSGGNVITDNINGKTDVYTAGGNIQLGNISGRLDVKTNGGNIIVGAVGGGKAELETMGGNVMVDKTSQDLTIKTYGGNILVGDVGGNAKAVTMGGNIVFSDVKGSAELKTYGGNLRLTGASGEVKAVTMGGNIDLKGIKGKINAETAGGDIYAELIPSGSGNSSLESSSGDIELLIPASSKVNIEARISGYGWFGNEPEYEIKSDFEAKTYKADKENGKIRAEYILNGGGTRIELKTVNSDIKIKKMK